MSDATPRFHGSLDRWAEFEALEFEKEIAVRVERNRVARERSAERRMRDGALNRHRLYMRKYGLSESAARFWLAATFGPCEVCLVLPVEGERHCIDHCHRTGRVRGVLCGRCNTLVGQLENNDAAVIASARLYLTRKPEDTDG